MARNYGNLTGRKSTSTERLFYSPAFVVGFGDHRAERPFRYPDHARGPGLHLRSAQLAYERGRQFSAWLGPRRDVTNLTALKDSLAAAHRAGDIT